MTVTQTVLKGKDTAPQGELYMSFELGDKSWKLTLSDGRRGPGRYNVAAATRPRCWIACPRREFVAA
jgi:transposase